MVSGELKASMVLVIRRTSIADEYPYLNVMNFTNVIVLMTTVHVLQAR
eukprot:SAG11_NODE_14_length_26344_cov_14.209411_8_plen_48_part_00